MAERTRWAMSTTDGPPAVDTVWIGTSWRSTTRSVSRPVRPPAATTTPLASRAPTIPEIDATNHVRSPTLRLGRISDG